MSAAAEMPFGRPESMIEIARAVAKLDRARTMEQVVAELEAIQLDLSGSVRPTRRRLAGDGVACFNFMYLTVTRSVAEAGEFANEDFVRRLAVVFAEFYLVAYRAGGRPADVAKAWRPLFAHRRKRGVAPLRFAIAGLNAHINNDLAWALVQVWKEQGRMPGRGSPEYLDFQEVNEVLEIVQPQVRSVLQGRFLRWLDRVLGRIDDRIAGFSIAEARTEAWERAELMFRNLDIEREERHERQVAFECNLLLGIPVPDHVSAERAATLQQRPRSQPEDNS